MRITREIELGGETVTVKELTVGEIRQWLAGLRARPESADLVDVALLADIHLDDLLLASDLDKDGLDRLTQSELRELLATVREVNPDFFGLRARLLAASSTV